MIRSLIRFCKNALKDKNFRTLLIATVIYLTIGTFFYSLVENWRLLDSLYFCVTTLATVGLGDFYPTTDAGKIFTIFYILIGVGLLAAFISRLFNGFKNNVEKRNNK